MTHYRCNRLWEVEAARDDRLLGDALADSKRHQTHCSACIQEVERLEAMGRALQQAGPAPLDPLSLRRIRQELLAHADARRFNRHSVFGRRMTGTAALILVLVGIVGGAAKYGRTLASNIAQLVHRQVKNDYSIWPDLDARWSQREDGEHYHVRLDAGTLRLASNGRAKENHLVVDVPDGYIQDRGTRFTVTVEFHKTQRITVEQGAIAFNRSDGSLILMSEGQTWLREGKSQTAESPSDRQEPKTLRPSVVVNTRIQPLAIQNPSEVRGGPSEPVNVNPTQSRQDVAPPPSSIPQTESQEDLAYLQVLKLLSESRHEEARMAAQEYLRRFPTGFRKLEVERIAQ